MKKKLLTVLFGATLVLGACGGGGDKATDGGNNNAGGNETAAGVDVEKVVQTSCINCHGGDLEGRGAAPALNDVGSRLSEEEIHDVIVNGRGGMPAISLKEEEANAVAQWLAEKK